MSRKKEKYQKKPFESDQSSSDTSSNIYESMMKTRAWKDLTAQQKVLYLTCKSQYYCDKPPIPEDRYTFTMNKYKWCTKYELYDETNAKGFYRDMTALVAHGFVICVSSGMATRTKSVYRFSEMFWNWGTKKFVVLPSQMSYAMRKKLLNGKETLTC